MTHEKLSQLNELSNEIKELEKNILSAKNHRCDWIEFTFGNGSSRANVCNDSEIIQLVKELIIKENELKLEDLKKEFSEL